MAPASRSMTTCWRVAIAAYRIAAVHAHIAAIQTPGCRRGSRGAELQSCANHIVMNTASAACSEGQAFTGRSKKITVR